MGQILHGSATTTEVVRQAIQNSQEPESAFEALWDQSKDGCQMEETNIGVRFADWTEGATFNRSLGLSRLL